MNNDPDKDFIVVDFAALGCLGLVVLIVMVAMVLGVMDALTTEADRKSKNGWASEAPKMAH